MKQLSTARNIQRNSQLYREENKEEGDRFDLEEKRDSQKGRKQSNQ